MTAKANLRVVVDLDDNASPKLGGLGKALGGIGGIAKGALLGGIGVAAAGIAGLGATLVSATKEAMESQDVVKQLDQVLKTTGKGAQVSSGFVQMYASRMQDLTKFTDEETISAATLLLQFDNIGRKALPQATEAAMNLSTRLGVDLDSAARMVGKALNEPVEGLGALRRAGIQLAPELETAIAAMIESGDVAGAQAIVFQALEGAVGGAARAAGETFSGQMAIMKNQLADVKEQVGTALLPALMELATILGPYLIGAAQALGEFLTTTFVPWLRDVLIPAIRDDLIPWIRDVLVPALQDMWRWIQTYIIPAIQDLATWIRTDLVPEIQALATWITTYVVPAIQSMAEWIRTQLIPAIQDIATWVGTYLYPPFKTFFDNSMLGFQIWRDTAVAAFNIVKGAVQSVIDTINGIQAAINNAIGWIQNLLDKINEALGKIGAFAANSGGTPTGGYLPPNFQSGTLYAPGGLALVGERGPELVQMPRGSRVYNAEDTAAALQRGEWTVNMTLVGSSDPQQVGRAAERGILRAAWAMGAV